MQEDGSYFFFINVHFAHPFLRVMRTRRGLGISRCKGVRVGGQPLQLRGPAALEAAADEIADHGIQEEVPDDAL